MTKEEWQALDDFEIAAVEAGGYVQPPKPMTKEEEQAEREKVIAWIKKHKEEQQKQN